MPAGVGDRAHGRGRSDALRELRVRRRAADGDLGERVPDPLLEQRTAQVERQSEAEAGRLDEPDDAGDDALELRVAPDQLEVLGDESVLQRWREVTRF